MHRTEVFYFQYPRRQGCVSGNPWEAAQKGRYHYMELIRSARHQRPSTGRFTYSTWSNGLSRTLVALPCQLISIVSLDFNRFLEPSTYLSSPQYGKKFNGAVHPSWDRTRFVGCGMDAGGASIHWPSLTSESCFAILGLRSCGWGSCNLLVERCTMITMGTKAPARERKS